MAEIIKHEFQNGWEMSDAAREPSASELEVNVIFTDPKGTAAALETASDLARDLNARVQVIAAQAVPFAFPLSKPPVATDFQENQLLKLVDDSCDRSLQTTVHLYLCRNALDTLAQTLPRNSVVVMGGGRWWFGDAQWLARSLRSIGHHVIYVANRPAASDPNRVLEAIARTEQARKHA